MHILFTEAGNEFPRGRKGTIITLNWYSKISSLGSLRSGVTKVGVTRGGNWWCHLFFAKKIDDLFSHRHLQSDDLFSCRLVTTHLRRRLSRFFLNSATKKYFCLVSSPWMMSPGAVRPLVTPLSLQEICCGIAVERKSRATRAFTVADNVGLHFGDRQAGPTPDISQKYGIVLSRRYRYLPLTHRPTRQSINNVDGRVSARAPYGPSFCRQCRPQNNVKIGLMSADIDEPFRAPLTVKCVVNIYLYSQQKSATNTKQ